MGADGGVVRRRTRLRPRLDRGRTSLPGRDLFGRDELAIHYLYLAVGVLLLLPAIFGRQDQGLIRQLLRNPVVQWLGVVSYGLYLWNETMIEKYLEWSERTAFNTSLLTMLMVVTIMTVAIAALSYYLFEEPVLALRGDRRRKVV